MLDFNNYFIKYKDEGFEFILRPGGYIPKSGLLLAEYFLKNKNLTYSNALEIGIGEIAFLPIILVKNNITKHVDAIDIDPVALKWATKNVEKNKLKNFIDLYGNFSELPGHKYDLIYSNPPQLPVSINTSLHDDGGADGYDVINQVINFSENNLNKNGKLILLAFDFLNIEESFNGKETLLSKLSEKGFDVVCEKKLFKKIRKEGKIEKNLDWIKKQYPLYNFNKNGDLGYSIIIIEAIKI